MAKKAKATIDTEWTYPAKAMTLYDLKLDEDLAVPGMLVEFRDESAKKGRKTIALIGDLNPLLGECDDCHADYKAQVVRYRRVWVP